MSHLSNKSNPTPNARPLPQVADQPKTDPWCQDSERDAMEDVAVFTTFLKRNLTSPPPPVPKDLLSNILDRIDAVDAEQNKP